MNQLKIMGTAMQAAYVIGEIEGWLGRYKYKDTFDPILNAAYKAGYEVGRKVEK